jgi:cytidyltransferase-like protein
MIKVFVSGCYDILHAGHITFFEQAKALGDHLTVCFASERSLLLHKGRKPSIPDDHKRYILSNLKCVDAVVSGDSDEYGLDFMDHFLHIKPDILAVTEDDMYSDSKKQLCNQIGAQYVVLPKTPPDFESISTTRIIKCIQAPVEAPLRVDFAGGWLDVPKYVMYGGYIVNCAISPTVSLNEWSYHQQAGLGGSGAWAILNGVSSVDSELQLGAGWQDPAVISETGCCVWRSNDTPVLDFKQSGEFLKGRMALYWTGTPHTTSDLVNLERDYTSISSASRIARFAVLNSDITALCNAVNMSYKAQLKEGMIELPAFDGALAKKYCGSGHGGYALYIFGSRDARDNAVSNNDAITPIEPYISLKL